MTPEEAHAIRVSFERSALGPLSDPDTPVGFYWKERFGPAPTSAQLWRAVYELSDEPVYNGRTTV